MEPQKMIDLLTANGLPPAAARVLACWNDDDDELTAWDLEIAARMRQPEVSIATSYMRERGWLSLSLVKQTGKGRPTHLYRLALPMREIVEEIVADRNREIEMQMECAARLLQAVA